LRPEEAAVTARPYDPTLKALVETEPESWPAWLGRPTGPTTVIDADIATVSGAGDKVLRVAAEPPYLLHLEFVAGIIERMGRRLGGRRVRRQAAVVWAAAYVLLGLRYSAALAAQLFRGVVSMKESSTYQAILEEGRQKGRREGREEGRTEGAVAEARKALRLVGDGAIGEPDARTAAIIERLDDLGRLEELLTRVRTAVSWQELLGPPAPRRRGKRRPGAP
jgi:predicted transposase YdaD